MASGLILLANIRMQVLSVAIQSTRDTDQILESMATPRKTYKEFQDLMALVSNAIRREALVNRQPWNRVSGDTLRRITTELGNAPDALSYSISRLLGRLVDASIQVDRNQAQRNLTLPTSATCMQKHIASLWVALPLLQAPAPQRGPGQLLRWSSLPWSTPGQPPG